MNRIKTLSPTFFLILAALTGSARGDEPPVPTRVRFNRDVRPILSDNCFQCHGPDKGRRKADLRLDQREAAVASKAVIPGKTEESELLARVMSTEADEIMPPPAMRKKLSARQKEILKRWIEQGAEYEKHWAYVPLEPIKPPVVRLEAWPRNGLDRFILARLEQEKLEPSPEASKEVLIRRVTLDLTGLPPTLAEVDAFLLDNSADAYEKVVDRLLKSPAYGERMAVDWLDAARYADSNGYQVDRDRELWPWRDWVIRAFNDNKPFDQFTIEQIAGDLLPNPTLDQKVATGFHRNHMLNEEGGIIPEEFLAEYTADRVETTAAVWLGQTFNCARCHDHKYDPFTQRDFYAMKAFFHNVPEKGVGNYGSPIRINAPPFVKLPAPEIEAKIAGLNAKRQETEKRLAALTSKSSSGLEEWAKRLGAEPVRWEPLEIVSARVGTQPARIDASGGVYVVPTPDKRPMAVKLKAKPKAGRVSAIRVEYAAASSSADVQWNELKLTRKQPLTLRAAESDDSITVAEAAKVLDKARNTRSALSLAPNKPARAVFELETPLNDATPSEIEVDLGLQSATGATRLRLSVTDAAPELLVPSSLLSVARKEVAKRTAAEKKKLADFRLAQDPEHRRLVDEAEALKKQIATAEGEIPTTLVMEEMKEARPTFVLKRGAYDKPGEAVTAATPAVLPPLDEGLPRNRLGLAKWLVGPRNPLTARVTVNRFWQQVFGTGLVRGSEDFGSQGDAPSHPELLDWLSLTFRESGWNVKGLMRLIVTSATYRQRSNLNPTLRERDPDNRLLARGPRHRLSAETIRDQALAASGLLAPRLGGPSVRPYHPPGLYEQVTAGNGYNVYVAGKGDELRRRSMYTYWKRSVPHPAMLLFDAPFRETCALRRPRTNTPLQALNLMNDPTYVEAARFLAQRMMREGGDSVDGRINVGFRLLLAREPRPRELAVLRAAFLRAKADFQADAAAAKAFLAVGDAGMDAKLNTGELAAFAVVADTLLNLDEAVTKE